MSESQARREESPRADRTKKRATPSRDGAPQPKEKRPNIFKRMVIFVSQVISEMKKVIYPSGCRNYGFHWPS